MVSRKPQPGDEVLVKTKQKDETGILLESHELGIILLKLKTGYNLGIKKRDISSIKVMKKAKEEEVEDKKVKMKGKPIIDFYLTGGTISSKLDPKTGGVKDLTKPEEFFSMYPEIFDVVDIRVKSPFTKWSENIYYWSNCLNDAIKY